MTVMVGMLFSLAFLAASPASESSESNAEILKKIEKVSEKQRAAYIEILIKRKCGAVVPHLLRSKSRAKTTRTKCWMPFNNTRPHQPRRFQHRSGM